MSSARISALKGGIEVPPGTAAAHRASDAADPAGGFAAALGAMAANFRAPSGDHSHGSGDASVGDDHTGTHAADDTQPGAAEAPSQSADADATPTATLPGLAGWFTAGANPATAGTAATGHRAPAKPGAAAAGAVAAAVAASLAGAATQPTAATPATPTAAANAPVRAATQPTQTGFEARVPGDTGSLASHPHAASIGAAGARDADTPAAKIAPAASDDPTAPAVPSITADAGLRAPNPAGSDPSAPVVAGDLAQPLAQAAASPAPASNVETAALAAAAPAVAAMISPTAASTGGSGTRDFADTARDGQAQAAAAFSGVAAASSGTATAGGVGAPSAGAAGMSASGLGADAGTANVATQLSGQVLRLLTNSGHEAVVRLYPPDLGEVTVRVAISGRDVSAWFGSPQLEVQQTISLGLGQLQTDLGNAGYSLNNAWVGADASGFGPQGGGAPPPSTTAPTTQAAPVTPAAATLSSNSGVSIYV